MLKGWSLTSRMSMAARHHQRGYTLIELLLYVAIVGILLSGVTVFFGVVAEARIKNQSISEVNDQGNFALNYIAQTVRGATSITSPAIGATGTQLTVTVPTGSLSPTIFDVSSGVLRVQEGAAAAIPLTNSKVQVTNFSIKNLTRSGTHGVAEITLTLSRINSTDRNEYDYERTFKTSAALRQ